MIGRVVIWEHLLLLNRVGAGICLVELYSGVPGIQARYSPSPELMPNLVKCSQIGLTINKRKIIDYRILHINNLLKIA